MSDRRKVTNETAETKHLLAVKRWQKSQKKMYLSNKIYNTWQMLKYQGPYQTDPDFAVYLISLEIRKRKKGKYDHIFCLRPLGLLVRTHSF